MEKSKVIISLFMFFLAYMLVENMPFLAILVVILVLFLNFREVLDLLNFLLKD